MLEGWRKAGRGGKMDARHTVTSPVSSDSTDIPCACGPLIDSSFFASAPPSPSAPGRRPPQGPWSCGAAWRLVPWCRWYCCHCCSSHGRSSPPPVRATTSRPCFLFLCPSFPRAPSLTTSSLVATTTCVCVWQAAGVSVSGYVCV